MKALCAMLAVVLAGGCSATEGAAIVAGTTTDEASTSGTTASADVSSTSTDSTGNTSFAEESTGPAATTGAVPPFSLLLEAELAALTVPFEIAADPEASGGEYILVMGMGGRHPEAEARFTVEVPADGLYKLWPRVLANDLASNSFTLELDGVVAKENWTWAVDTSWRTAGDVEFELLAGPHEIVVRGREAGTQLDYLVISSASSEPPPEP